MTVTAYIVLILSFSLFSSASVRSILIFSFLIVSINALLVDLFMNILGATVPLPNFLSTQSIKKEY